MENLLGDPTETALIDMAFKLDYKKDILTNSPRVKEVPFDSERKLMTTVNKVDGKYIVYTKGGVDELLKRCNTYLMNGEIKQDIEEYSKTIRTHNENMAKEALRVLACSYKILENKPTDEEMKNIEKDLTFRRSKKSSRKMQNSRNKNSNDNRRPQNNSNSNSKKIRNTRKRRRSNNWTRIRKNDRRRIRKKCKKI